MKVLHLSPHPDDEAIGAPATLRALASQGYEIDNLALSFGQGGKESKDRREGEVRLSCERLGFNLLVPDRLPQINAISSPDDFLRGEEQVASILLDIISDYHLLVSPTHVDVHPAHEIVARALRRVLPEGTPWWQWALWSDLPFPSLLYSFGQREMKHLEYALSAHKGELARNDYTRLLRARAEAAAILAPEKVFTFGGEGIAEPYAEAFSALKKEGGRWRLSSPSHLDLDDPLGSLLDGLDLTFWVESDSSRYRLLVSASN